VCTTRAARNMAFQGIFAKSGSVEQLAEIPGAKIVGTKIKAPFSINEEVYVLPMDNVLATKVRDYVTTYIEMSHHTCRARVLLPPSRPTRPTILQHSRTCGRSRSFTRSIHLGHPLILFPLSAPLATAK
jgi:hypothetical protein